MGQEYTLTLTRMGSFTSLKLKEEEGMVIAGAKEEGPPSKYFGHKRVWVWGRGGIRVVNIPTSFFTNFLPASSISQK